MKILKKILLGLGITVLSLAIVLGIAFAVIKVPTLTVDFSQQTDLTGSASGFLYGMAEDEIPTDEITESIGISMLATKPAGGLQHPIGDVEYVADTFTNAGGEYLLIYTQDMYDTWYYEFDSLELYNEKVKKTVTEMESSEYKDKLVYCIYNEMDNGAWFGSHWEEANRYAFYDAWLSTYNVVKEINPDAKIAGPGHCGYNYDWNKEFLNYCKENNCLPDMFIWHELNGEYSVYWMEYRFDEFNATCDELGIERMPICISEYGLMQTNGLPGESVKWMSRLEARDVYGCVAYWRLANNLAETVADDVTPNANYWVYKFYADMKGKELEVSEWDLFNSNIGNWLKGKYPLLNKGFIGMASFDEEENKFYILAGGSDEKSNIKIENIDEAYFKNGDKVTVTVKYVDFKGLGGAVYAPEDCYTEVTKVSGNKIKLSLPCQRESQAYLIEIAPYNNEEESENENRTLRFEAEDAEYTGSAYVPDWISYASSEGLVVKGIDKNNNITFTVNAPADGTYNVDFVYANGGTDAGRINADVTISIEGNEDVTTKFPSTIKDEYMECVSLKAELKKGKNEITLQVLNDAIITMDFVDIDLVEEENIYCEPLASRNADENENAYSVVVPNDGQYYLELSVIENTVITIDGTECKGSSAEGSSLSVYMHRGYNKVVLSNEAQLISVKSNANAQRGTVITPNDMQIFNGATIEDDANTESGKRIGWISSENGGYATFKYTAEKSGYYAFTFEYCNNEEGGAHAYNVDLVERYISFTVNGESQGKQFFRSTYSWETYKTKTVVLYLNEGENEIKLSNDGSYSFNNNVTYAPNLGSVEVNAL